MIRAKLAAFLLLFAFIVPAGTAVVTPTTTYACAGDSFLLIPAWYQGVQDGCNGVKVEQTSDGLQKFVIKVALNIVRAALVIAGYAAVFFIIKGGFLYIIARGDPGHISAAKQTITNAIIGLIICISSAAIVTAIAGAI